jgi:hypothetical protein
VARPNQSAEGWSSAAHSVVRHDQERPGAVIREMVGSQTTSIRQRSTPDKTGRLALVLAARDMRVLSNWSRRACGQADSCGQLRPGLGPLDRRLDRLVHGADPGQPAAVAGHLAAIVKDEFGQRE